MNVVNEWKVVKKNGKSVITRISTNNIKKLKATNPLMDKFAPAGTNQPIEVTYSHQQYAEACARGMKLGHLKNSITKGRSNVWGMLGEAIVAQYTNSKLVDTFQYDLLSPTGEKLEVKTKKTTLTVAPKTYFECSVCDHNSKQNCDYYVFVRVSTNCKKAWICGQVHKTHLKKRARYFKKGDTDPRNNYKVHASCWNLNIAELDEVPKFSSN